MSPSGTMARVYAALKTQIMAGMIAPGDRLDPSRLSDDLAASVTPVRDALHRLTGERLVDSWQQEGFRIPLVTETTLRDLYVWSSDVLNLALRAIDRSPSPVVSDIDGIGIEPDMDADFGALLTTIASLCINREHRLATISLNERGAILRPAEMLVLDDADSLSAMGEALNRKAWGETRSHLTHYFRRRLARVSDIAALMRAREPM